MTNQNVKSFLASERMTDEAEELRRQRGRISSEQASVKSAQKLVKKHLVFRPIVTEKKLPLGIYTKSHVTLMWHRFGDFENVTNYFNVTNFLQSRNNLGFVSFRVEKFALQDKARQILSSFKRQTTSGKFTNVYRVCNCCRSRVSKDKGVGLYYNKERDTANFGNVQRCFSVWTCPVCASSISEFRRKELKRGMQNWISQGGSVYLVTMTSPHYVGNGLKILLDAQKRALIKFWSNTRVVQMLAKLGYVGRINAFEATWSKNNGWHPHYHMLFFFKNPINFQALQSFLAIEWRQIFFKMGCPAPNLSNGLTVQDGTYASRYVGKWGLDYELTKGHTKKGRNCSLTPFDFLRFSDGSDNYADLFVEFAQATKGKRQLVWSDGLKDLLGIQQKSDDEIIADTEKKSDFLRELSWEIWHLVLHYNARAKVLELVEWDYLDNGDRLDRLILGLAERYVNDMYLQCA